MANLLSKLLFSTLQGERLSHAVGCAFAICLERKQKRDKDCTVSMNFDSSSSSFTRLGSFRQATITERLQDPQVVIPIKLFKELVYNLKLHDKRMSSMNT